MSFSVTVTGHYTDGPETLDTSVGVTWQSDQPHKRLAELAVLAHAFADWMGKTREALTAAAEPQPVEDPPPTGAPPA